MNERDFDFGSRPLQGIAPDLLEFLKAKVNTFIKWDLVRFFHENPHTTDIADNIARYAWRAPAEIAAELAQMANDGILSAHMLGSLPVYTLTEDAPTRDLIARFVLACEDRDFRVKAIYYTIRSPKH